MKSKLKHLLLLILLIISIIPLTTRASMKDTSKVNLSTVYHDVKNGMDVNAPKIEKAIGTIAKDLKVTADKVWNILVKQQKVWSYCFLLLTLSALINWHFFYKNNFIRLSEKTSVIGKRDIKRQIENPQFESYYEGRSGYKDDIRSKRYIDSEIGTEDILLPLFTTASIKWFKYLHLAICLTLSIFSYLHFASMLTGFLNPEFGAMQTIAEVAQNIK